MCALFDNGIDRDCVEPFLKNIFKGVDEKGNKIISFGRFFKYKENFDKCVFSLLRKKEPVWQTQTLEKNQKRVICNNYIAVLKRYNSFTPALPRPFKLHNHSRGGGYFMQWMGKGIAIDPGFDFIKNLDTLGLAVGNIDAIILTHGHNDHYIDIDPILALIFEHNDLLMRIKSGGLSYNGEQFEDALRFFSEGLEINSDDDTCKIGIILSTLKLAKKNSESGLPTEENHDSGLEVPYWQKLSKDEISEMQKRFSEALEKIIKMKPRKIDLIVGRSAEKTVSSIIPLAMNQIRNVYFLNTDEYLTLHDYGFGIKAVPAKHNDFYSGSHCVGLRFSLKDPDNSRRLFDFGITSDTGYYYRYEKLDNRTIANELYCEYTDCPLLITHIGSIKPEEFDWLHDKDYVKHLYKKHLGILGLVRLVCKLRHQGLDLVIIGEYGEEMKIFRKKLTDMLNAGNVFNKEPVFRSGDIGLVINLDSFKNNNRYFEILVDNYTKSIPSRAVKENDSTGAILYES